MTSRQQHERQAKDNLELHGRLLQEGKHLDWAVTTLFYAALHYVDAFLLPEDPRTHERRNQRIRARGELRPIYRSYKLLLDRSRDARYECFDPTPEQVRYYRTRHFDPLQAHLFALLEAKDRA